MNIILLSLYASPRMLRMRDPFPLPLDGKYYMFALVKENKVEFAKSASLSGGSALISQVATNSQSETLRSVFFSANGLSRSFYM